MTTRKRILLGVVSGILLLVFAGAAVIVVSSYLEHRELVEVN